MSDILFKAVKDNDLNAVKSILDKDPEQVNSKDARGSTPVLLAAYYGLEEMTALLLSFNPNLNTQDGSGNTALMGMSFKGYDTPGLFLRAAFRNRPGARGETGCSLHRKYAL